MDLGICLLFHLIFILGLCFCDLLLPLLVHFFLQFFLFPKVWNIKESSKSYLNKSHKEQQSMIKGTYFSHVSFSFFSWLFWHSSATSVSFWISWEKKPQEIKNMYFQLNITEAAKFSQKSAADTKVLCHSQINHQWSKASKHYYQCKHIINLWSSARMLHIQLTQKLLLLCTSRWYSLTILNVKPRCMSSILPLLGMKMPVKNHKGSQIELTQWQLPTEFLCHWISRFFWEGWKHSSCNEDYYKEWFGFWGGQEDVENQAGQFWKPSTEKHNLHFGHRMKKLWAIGLKSVVSISFVPKPETKARPVVGKLTGEESWAGLLCQFNEQWINWEMGPIWFDHPSS